MLNADCRSFRDHFEPGRADRLDPELVAHRRGCPACDAFAGRLEQLEALKADRPMPAALRRRLLRIPAEEISCGAVDRLYAAARHPELDDPIVRRHLATCRCCARVYGTLTAALTVPGPGLPQALAERLRRIALPTLPRWARDARFSLAASYVLTACVMIMVHVSDAQARLRFSSETVSSRVTTLAEESSRRGRALRHTVERGLEASIELGRERLITSLEAQKKLYFVTLQIFFPTQDPNDEPENDLSNGGRQND